MAGIFTLSVTSVLSMVSAARSPLFNSDFATDRADSVHEPPLSIVSCVGPLICEDNRWSSVCRRSALH